MTTPLDLLARLDAIGQSLAQEEAALALLGLGSVGVELNRLDTFSDLDFFVIARGAQVALPRQTRLACARASDCLSLPQHG